MTERNVHALRAEALAMLAEATQAANSALDIESALAYLTAAREVVGDKEAHIRPGWVAQHQCPLVLTNTDEAADFRQILKTACMGSALFGLMVWQGQMLGQVITAAQARHTYRPIDLDIFMGFAHLAAAVYMAHGGPEWLRTLV